jgi:DNA-binding transcriptional LysR family regulator
MTPSLDRLQVLEALLRLRSPSLAAVELGVTQSAVSKTLSVLRAELLCRKFKATLTIDVRSHA